jgi:chromate transporter
VLQIAVTNQPYSLSRLVAYFLKLGAIGFGGPVALVGYMSRDLVGERGWYTLEEYQRGLAFAQLAPGPMATQLAMYLGYLRSGIIGATAVGLFFVLPSFLIVVALGYFYLTFGSLVWITSAFYGVGAAVIAVIVKASYKLVQTTLKKDLLLWAIFTLSFGVTLLLGEARFLMFICGGLVALLVSYVFTNNTERSAPRAPTLKSFALIPAMSMLALSPSFLDILWYFLKAGFIVFGSGLAIVPFLRGGVVSQYHWLTDRQFLDAVAVALITPGPAVITVAFIGYLVKGFWGSVAAAIGVFLPVYLFVVVIGPLFERLSSNLRVRAFIGGVTAVATGALAAAVLLLGKDAVVDLPTAIILIISFVVLFKFKVPDVIVIVAAAIVGVILRGV